MPNAQDYTNEGLMERLLTDARPTDHLVLMDVYDQCMWVQTQETTGVSAELIERHLGECARVHRVARLKQECPWLSDVHVAEGVEMTLDALHELLAKMRRFHIFDIRKTAFPGVFRVPSGAADRLRDASLALEFMPTPVEVSASLIGRYGV